MSVQARKRDTLRWSASWLWRVRPNGRVSESEIIARDRRRKLVLAPLGLSVPMPAWYTEYPFIRHRGFRTAPELDATSDHMWRIDRAEAEHWQQYHRRTTPAEYWGVK